ncbi:MAG: hypothetical protein KKB20_15130 [Proteobacteria bacterium]|nr:hypothetical protein [Pseudomonadota bacterium]
MRKLFLVAVFLPFILALTAAAPSASQAQYKKTFPEGYCNCVFSPQEISKDKEGSVQLKDSFAKPEKVYARCYFSGPVGKVKGPDFWHELWVDRKLVSRTKFKEPPDANWDQIQIWITEDEYKKQMQGLAPGKHEVTIWVMKNTFQGKRAEAERDASGKIVAKDKEIWVPVRLSKGNFTYTVK